jgi:hypothetical protein
MKHVKLIMASVSSIIILIMMTSALAYSLDFYYFQTDKLIYEVGETIDMVSKIKADFSEEGWCYVSFTIVTDMGLVYTDEYFIPPSPDIRHLYSSYIISPNETAPGLFGVQALAIFRVELYDGVLQTAGDTIELNITRGHLQAVPQTPLIVEYGTNTTLLFKITSMYNDNITIPSEMFSIEVTDLNGTLILQKNTLSNTKGIVSLLWNASTSVPGEYNFTISGNGTDAFLPFSQSFQLHVDPASSTLNAISYPESIFCQSGDGEHTESVDLIVEHLGNYQNPILSSYVTWKTDFSQGDMVDLGNGQYMATIEFPVVLGLYSINLTAINPLYQTAKYEIEIEVLPRNISIGFEMLEIAIAGHYLCAQITVNDTISGSGIDSMELLINVSIENTVIDTNWEITNSSGVLIYNIFIPDMIWGDGIIFITSNETIHYISDSCSFPLNVSFLPIVVNESELIGILGYETEIRLVVYNPKGEAVAGILYDFFNSNGEHILNGTSNLSGAIEFIFSISETAKTGLQRYMLLIHTDSSLKVNGTFIFLEINIRIPLRFLPSNEFFSVVRGENVTIQFILESEFLHNQTINIELHDTNEEFSVFKTVTTDIIEIVNISIDNHVSLGSHSILVIIEKNDYQPMGLFETELKVFALFNFDATINTLYYGESLNFSISTYSNDIAPSFVNIHAYFDFCNYSITIENCTTNLFYFVNLSGKVYPGEHILIFNVSSPWYINTSKQISVFVWMKTTIHIAISVLEHEINQGESIELINSSPIHLLDMTSNISSGSIISPPPILFNGTTSIIPPTARVTSLESCPRFNSGTNTLSTVCTNFSSTLSGNGHKIRSLNDFKDTEESFVSNSSTDLEVQPYDMIPQSAFFGPEIEKSVNNSLFFWILDVIRRTRRL